MNACVIVYETMRLRATVVTCKCPYTFLCADMSLYVFVCVLVCRHSFVMCLYLIVRACACAGVIAPDCTPVHIYVFHVLSIGACMSALVRVWCFVHNCSCSVCCIRVYVFVCLQLKYCSYVLYLRVCL